MKTKEELNALKEEYQSLTTKLRELTDDELKIVTGGVNFDVPEYSKQKEFHIYENSDSPNEPFKQKDN